MFFAEKEIQKYKKGRDLYGRSADRDFSTQIKFKWQKKGISWHGRNGKILPASACKKYDLKSSQADNHTVGDTIRPRCGNPVFHSQ